MSFNLTESLALFYSKRREEIRNSGKVAIEHFSDYDKLSLLEPENWYKALAVFEWALESSPAEKVTEEFFHLLFRSYDFNASAELSDEEYEWHWHKIHDLLDMFSAYSPSAIAEKGFQYYSARRGYEDKEKTVFYLEKAIERGDEVARIILGYYLYFGFCGITDKERGMQLIESDTTHSGKIRATIYKGYVALFEDRPEETKRLLEEAEEKNTDENLSRIIYEQKGYLMGLEKNYEEAAINYRKTLDVSPSSGFALMSLAYLNYNKSLENPTDEKEALQMMENAFRYGRIDVLRNLYFCLFDSETAWQDNEKGIYWLEKGFQYNDSFCTAELAYLYLYNENYKDLEKGLYYLDLAIEMKHADAMVSKAYLFLEGIGVEKDVGKALELLDEAASLGHANAAFRAGTIYEEGHFHEEGSPDYAKALSYYEKAADMGDGQGCGYAGRYYLIGLSVEEDLEKAKSYYEKGVELGNPYSIVELALMYEEGNGVEQDMKKSFELLTLASEQNYAYAWYLLGRCYKYELGTEENPDEAIACFEKAAEQNQAKAQAELGYCYETGYGVEINGKKALEYMLQSAENNYPFGQYKSGCYYLYGLEGVAPDNEKALEWLTKAVDNDYPYAMLEMGDYYLYNYGKTDERAKAYEYYMKAAQQDVVNEGLGLCLEYGYGVEENEGEAFKYYLKAAEDDYVRAKHFVAISYYWGYGVKKNPSEAYRWFNEAANQEHITATYYKAKMLLDGEGTSQNIAEGITLLKKAAEANEAEAQFELGNCYLTGKGVEENEELAMEWFEKAADNDHEQALKITGRRRRK